MKYLKALVNEFTIVIGIIVLLFVLTYSTPCNADAFPYYNGFGGYSTTLYLVNPTNQAVSVPIAGLPLSVSANGTFKFPNYPNTGGGVFSFAVPSNVTAFVELTDPAGSSVRFPAVSGFDKASIYGLATDSNQIAQVFVASSGFVRLSFYKDSTLVSEYEPNMTNGVAIEVAPKEANRVVVSSVNFSFGEYKPGPVFAFGFHRQVTGGFKIQNPVVAVEAK